jgi:hypothetical protein
MKKYLVLGGFLSLGFSGFAQVKRAYDPDDSIKVEKSRGLADSAALAVSAPWHWQQVDADFGVSPGSMHVYRTADSLGGRPELAYYVSVPLRERSVLFTSQVGHGKRYTPAQYYEQEGHPLLVINTSFFSFVTNGNLNLVVRDGRMLSWNQPSRRGKKDSVYHYTTRSALGITAGRKADVAWIFTDSTQPLPYAFEDGPAQGEGSDSIPALAALHDSHWKRWKMQTAVGGGPVLVYNGSVRVTNEEEGLFIHGEKDMHPRCAIGYTRDGRLIVLAVQGRTPGVAAGVTLAQEAKILRDLGCYEALNLDGGGSSCMLVNGKETIHPSDKGGERPVPAVFLIEAAGK